MGVGPAYVELARSIAAALNRFADQLQDQDGGDTEVRSQADVPTPEEEYNLGKRQRQIVNLAELAGERGVRTADIARAIEYEVPNTYTALQGLARAGIVELVPGKEPQHWRLGRRYRANSDSFLRMAGHVGAGEWTTYGDISIAVLGNHKAARAVGRAAATNPDFPNAHRVLLEGGLISPNWDDPLGRGPAECRRRLEAERITFDENGRADPSRRVTWDELMLRDGHE